MVDFGSKELGRLSNKAKQGRQEYEEILKYEQRQEPRSKFEQNIQDLKQQIIEDYKYDYRNILLENTRLAIEKTKEYNRLEKFSDNLENAIKYNIMEILQSIVSYGIYGIYDVMERVAGSLSDFWDGVENAREEMELGGGTKEQRARYWKNKVWLTEEMYEDTIAYRFQAWEDYAPYWYWIEHGNYFSIGAFPVFQQTNFLTKSAREIETDIDIKVEEMRYQEEEEEPSPEEDEVQDYYDQQEKNLFDEAQERFLANPDQYQPGFVFNRYKSLEDECEYKIVLTKTKLIGRRKIYKR